MFGTLVAVMDVPPIVWIAAALVVGALMVKFLVVPVLARLGMKGVAAVLVLAVVGAALYAAVTYFIASRGAQEFADTAAREKVRADAVRGRLAALAPTTMTLAEGCASASMMKLEELVIAFAGPGLVALELNRIGQNEEIRSHAFDSPTSAPTLGEVWEAVLQSPVSWEIRLPSILEYLLARKRYALVVAGDRADLIDLDGDHRICGGSLPEPFQVDPPGEWEAKSAEQVSVLASLCTRVEGDLCEQIKNTVAAVESAKR